MRLTLLLALLPLALSRPTLNDSPTGPNDPGLPPIHTLGNNPMPMNDPPAPSNHPTPTPNNNPMPINEPPPSTFHPSPTHSAHPSPKPKHSTHRILTPSFHAPPTPMNGGHNPGYTTYPTPTPSTPKPAGHHPLNLLPHSKAAPPTLKMNNVQPKPTAHHKAPKPLHKMLKHPKPAPKKVVKVAKPVAKPVAQAAPTPTGRYGVAPMSGMRFGDGPNPES